MAKTRKLISNRLWNSLTDSKTINILLHNDPTIPLRVICRREIKTSCHQKTYKNHSFIQTSPKPEYTQMSINRKMNK